jgi:hypothetical protein
VEILSAPPSSCNGLRGLFENIDCSAVEEEVQFEGKARKSTSSKDKSQVGSILFAQGAFSRKVVQHAKLKWQRYNKTLGLRSQRDYFASQSGGNIHVLI